MTEVGSFGIRKLAIEKCGGSKWWIRPKLKEWDVIECSPSFWELQEGSLRVASRGNTGKPEVLLA